MNIGDKAPEVLGINEQGKEILLSHYKGKKLVLYFYPKDNISLGFLWQRAASSENPVAHKDEYGLELSAVVQVTPTFFLQPDVQYIFNPIHSTGRDGAFVLQMQGVFKF